MEGDHGKKQLKGCRVKQKTDGGRSEKGCKIRNRNTVNTPAYATGKALFMMTGQVEHISGWMYPTE